MTRLCATFDAVSLERKLYINGQLLASDIASTVLTNSDSGDWLIGTRSYPNEPLNFSGNIDNVGIFNDVLSQEEIETRYNHTFNNNSEDILAEWKFNSGSGDLLYDHSGNQNHGTIVGATWEEGVSGCTDPYAENYDPDANLDTTFVYEL